MSTEENEALVRRYIEEGCNKRNLALIDELMAPDYVYMHPGVQGWTATRGPEAEKKGGSAWLVACPDITLTIEDMMAQGDKVALRLTCAAFRRESSPGGLQDPSSPLEGP